jgi:hypothetical protein
LRNLNPAVLFRALVAGLVEGVPALILRLSFAALNVNGDLSRYFGQGFAAVFAVLEPAKAYRISHEALERMKIEALKS